MVAQPPHRIIDGVYYGGIMSKCSAKTLNLCSERGGCSPGTARAITAIIGTPNECRGMLFGSTCRPGCAFPAPFGTSGALSRSRRVTWAAGSPTRARPSGGLPACVGFWLRGGDASADPRRAGKRWAVRAAVRSSPIMFTRWRVCRMDC